MTTLSARVTLSHANGVTWSGVRTHGRDRSVAAMEVVAFFQLDAADFVRLAVNAFSLQQLQRTAVAAAAAAGAAACRFCLHQGILV